MTKSRCETCGQWFEDDELDDHLNTHSAEQAEPEPNPTEMKCPDCQIGMEAYYGVTWD
jgi:rubredoxin